MKVKFANKVYEVLYSKEVAGKTVYAVEDEPNHIDWLVNVEVIDTDEESDDDEVKKEIINYFKCQSREEPLRKDIHNKWIAWLEKQGEMNIQNNNPLKIEPDKFYFCIKDYFAGGCYRSKKGDIVLAKNGMNMMGLSPEQASEYFISINSFKENAVAWFEKQTDKSQGKLALEAIQEEMVDNTNKIDPKFKVGDWVVQENIGVYKVIEICKSWYEVIDSEDNHYSISFDKECMYHLWTIEDAKPGDVLNANGIFIYKKHDKDNVYFYCGVNLTGEFICTCVDDIWSNNYKVYPATKGQYDLLFKKIQESGYEWDTEKKMLKHIPKFKAGNWIVFNGLTLYINEVEKGYYRTISKGGVPNSYDWNIDNAARLWTIEEARDGDVLAEDSCIFIIQKLCGITAAKTYCTLFDDDDFDSGSTLYFDIDSTKPATQEQRDILFVKMKEAGYEWNKDKKELKKL